MISFPRYIPDSVIAQFKQSLHHLAPYMQRFATILLETGRRISEVCSLPFDCLEQDLQEDWHLKVREIKLKKLRLIPISRQCLEAVEQQQKQLLEDGITSLYLFPARRQSKSPHVSARHFNTAINAVSSRIQNKRQ